MHLRKVWVLIAVVPAALALTATGSARLDATDGRSAVRRRGTSRDDATRRRASDRVPST